MPGSRKVVIYEYHTIEDSVEQHQSDLPSCNTPLTMYFQLGQVRSKLMEEQNLMAFEQLPRRKARAALIKHMMMMGMMMMGMVTSSR
eukprot:245216-Pelagomonas_calceolata.AAC.16